MTVAGAVANSPGMARDRDDPITYTRGTAPPHQVQFPRAQVVPRKVVVARDPRPSVERMLEDCAYTLGAQFAQFRAAGQTDIFTDKQASAFHKLVTSAAALQTLEERRVAAMRLASYSEAELDALEPAARKLLEESKASGRQ